MSDQDLDKTQRPGSRVTVAVTGATGDVGLAVLSALDRAPQVKNVRAMARRPFSPAAFGLPRVEYRQGDVRNRNDVRALVTGADSVLHLAFVLHGRRRNSNQINLDGSRIVFEEAVRSGAMRLCCASSIGGYGGQSGSELIDENAPFRGSPGHAYSEQKAEMERIMTRTLSGTAVAGYALRLSIVAGPLAQLVLRDIPYVRLRNALPLCLRRRLPSWFRPVLPDTGVPLQMVHEEDAAAAFVAAALGNGVPGTYNIAADGTVVIGELARELGWHSVRIPRSAVGAAARAARTLPPMAPLAWLEVARAPILVETERARTELGWTPRFTASEAMAALVDSYRQPEVAR